MRSLFFSTIYCLLALVIVTHAAHANFTIISETHHVEGWATSDSGTDSYDLTDNVPVSGSATGMDTYGGLNDAWSSAGNFAVMAEAGAMGSLGSEAFASSTYVFEPDWHTLRLTFDGTVYTIADEAWAGFQLYDITDNVLVGTSGIGEAIPALSSCCTSMTSVSAPFHVPT